MATKKGCLNFPFHEDTANQSLLHTTTINDTIASSIRCFLVTSPGQRRGNKIGSNLSLLKHQLLSEDTLNVASSNLEQELVLQFPGINFISINLRQTIDNGVITLNVAIKFNTDYTEISELSFII